MGSRRPVQKKEEKEELHFEVLVHLLRYMSYNNTLGLNYYADMNDAPVYDILIQVRIKTENHLVVFSDSSWQYFPDTGRSTVAYIIFYQGDIIDHGTHVPVPVDQSYAESEYNAACTSVMAMEHFRMLINNFLNKYLYVVPEEAPLIVLDSKSVMFMDMNVKVTKHTRHIARRIHFVRNGEK